MNAERWQQIKEVFNAALALPSDQRPAFVARACSQDPALQTEVESLLASHKEAAGFIEQPAIETTVELAGESLSGERVGSYKLLREIGHGGMGTVYLAARADEQYRKQVAIKIVSRGMDTDFILRRFRSERQILASLDHPNIARLFDGGSAEDGRPYFVMEYIAGKPIDAYCDSRKLSTAERLKLFRTVCSAVQYAHENAVIHRDIKPANMLVTAQGIPKLLDFGIAKIVKPELFSQTAHLTLTLQRVMTPEYASPEQVRNEPITIASDVYQLGILLYQLLTGHRPYRFQTRTPEEMARVICEQEPEKPSTAVSRVEEEVDADGTKRIKITPQLVSSTREGEPHKLQRRLAGDLDNIVLKAMHKEPQRRYASVEQFSEDIRRHLEGLPVVARKDTLHYRANKFIRRHKAWVGAALSALMLMAAIAAASYILLSRAEPNLLSRYFLKSSQPVNPSEWVQITKLPGSVVQPALSPDGRMLAFLRGPNTFVGQSELYVKLLPDGEPTQLTRDGTSKMSPAFSPDGSRIAYTVMGLRATWDTWVVPVLGGTPDLWLPNASGLAWIDQHRLLFSEIKAGSHMGIVTSLETRAESREIYLPRQELAMAHRSFASPDGKWVLVAEHDEKNYWRPCRLVPFDGNSVGRQVGPPDAPCMFAAWSPDGKWMYLDARSGSNFHLWRQRFPYGKPEQLTAGPTEEEGVAVAPDGQSLITAVGLRQRPIWFHDAAGDREVSREGYAFRPMFYAAGRKVLYRTSNGYQGMTTPSEIWAANLDSGRTERVLPGVQVIFYDLSTDGRLLVCALDSGSKPHLWLSPLDRRSPPRQIGSMEVTEALFGSPGVIYFLASEGTGKYLFEIREDGAGLRKVANEQVTEIHAVSPDGQWVSGWRPAPGHEAGNMIVAYPTSGGAPITISDPPCFFKWAPDGKYVYFSKPRGMTAGGAVGRTYVLPVRRGTMLPDMPTGGFRSEADLAAIRGVRVIDAADVGTSAMPDVYVFSRETTQRNLYRIPLR